jgi:ubiquinol-cytochrome c reductase iron-sulfur subunit
MTARRGFALATEAHPEDPNRRDVLGIAGMAFAAVGGAAALWPAIMQMNPDASTQALASTEVDIGALQPGQAITIMWRGKPVFIRNRTPEEVKTAQAVSVNDLPDRTKAADTARTKKGKENILVLVGICTHLGCIPKGQGLSDAKGDFGGWFCPCHGSHYDTAGRIRRGPAPKNLEVPQYEFLTDTRIRIG